MCIQLQFKWPEVAKKWQVISENLTPAFLLNVVFGFIGKIICLSQTFRTHTCKQKHVICLQMWCSYSLPNTKQTLQLSLSHSLCDERGSDRVFYQNWQGNHLAELDSSGVSGSAECGVHRKAPGSPSYLLQQLTLGGRSCVRRRWQACLLNKHHSHNCRKQCCFK